MVLHPITSSFCTFGSVLLGSGTLDGIKNPYNPEFQKEKSRAVGVEEAVGLWRHLKPSGTEPNSSCR